MNIQMFMFLAVCVVAVRIVKMALSKKQNSFEDEVTDFATHLVSTYVAYTLFCLVCC